MLILKYSTFLLCLLLLIGLRPVSYSQPKSYTVKNAHAHNDYLHNSPFFTAYNAGFGSIEVDVFPIDGKLHVAHDKKGITPERTLTSLYIEPILKTLPRDKSRKLILLVDIKENYQAALPILLNELIPLKPVLKRKQLKIVISGARPSPKEFKNYPKYIHFDDDQTRVNSRKEWKRVGMVSLRFSKLSSWKGTGEIQPEEAEKLKFTIDSVHKSGKMIRFWAAPDNLISWQLLKDLKVDLIGTDKILELSEFLKTY